MNLIEHGIKLRRHAVGHHKTTCPKCSHQRKNKNDQCLSVKIDNDGGAVWKCHHCDFKGNIAGDGFSNSSSRPIVYTKPAPISQKYATDADKKPLYDWFGKRGISRKTVDDFGISLTEKSFGAAPERCLVFPYIKEGEIVNYKYRTSDKRFRQEANAERTLFNIDRVQGDEIVFVEGEMDVLSLYEAGITYAVSLPDGAPKQAKLKEGDKRFDALRGLDLTKFSKVIIAVDMDEAGRALAVELEHRFGKDLCWHVKWPASNDVSCKDANEVLVEHGAEVLVENINLATPNPVKGIFEANAFVKDVVDIYEGRTQKPLSTGFINLDGIYKIMPSTFHLVTGIPNHGKSNFLDQILINMMNEHDWNFAVFSPEHSTPQHIRRLSEKIALKPFDAGINERMTLAELKSAINKIDNHFYFLESGDELPSIDWILQKTRAAILRHGVKGLVIDPYNMINAERADGKREDEHIRDLISACKNFCKKHEVVIWMVAHPNKLRRADGEDSYQPPSLYDVSGSAHWYNMADVGIVVHRDFETEQTQVITRKIREQGVYGAIGEAFFRFNLVTRSYEPIMPKTPQVPVIYD